MTLSMDIQKIDIKELPKLFQYLSYVKGQMEIHSRSALVESALITKIQTNDDAKVIEVLESYGGNFWEIIDLGFCAASGHLSGVKMLGFLDYLRNYIVKKGYEAPIILCCFCNKNPYMDRGVNMLRSYDGKTGKTVNNVICQSCNEKEIVVFCRDHNNFVFEKNRVVCPIFPEKCSIFNICQKPGCDESHARKAHKGMEKRSWKRSKKFLTTKHGEIIKSPLMVGVEFETIGVDNSATRKNIFRLDRNIGIDTDLSIRDYIYGTEIQTPPATNAKLENIVVSVTNAMKEGRFTVNGRCGSHIHIDLFKKYGKLSENPKFYKSLLAAYAYFESVFFDLVPNDRKNNRFALSLLPRYHKLLMTNKSFVEKKRFSKVWYLTSNVDDVERFKKELNLSREEMCSGSRHHATKYMWANFHSLIRGEGLEIRLLEGTLDSNLVLNWINLHQRFIEGVSKYEKKFYELYDDQAIKKSVEKYNFFTEILGNHKETNEFVAKRYNSCALSGSVYRIAGEDEYEMHFSSSGTNIFRDQGMGVGHSIPYNSRPIPAPIPAPVRTVRPRFTPEEYVHLPEENLQDELGRMVQDVMGTGFIPTQGNG